MGLLHWLGLTGGADQTGILTPWRDGSHLAPAMLEHLFTITDGPVTRSTAMRIPAVARGRNVITGQLGRIPWEARTATGVEDVPWLRHPEPGRAAALTWAWTADAMLFYGRAWWIVTERDTSGMPAAFQWIPEHAVNAAGDKFYAHDRPIRPRDVVRIDGPHEGILVTAQDTLKAASAMHRAYARTAYNPVPTVELHQTAGDRMDPDEIDALIASWVAARQGANGGVGFTNKSVEARVHGAPVEQLLIAGRKAVTLEVAGHLNLPAWAVDGEVGGSSLTYSNVPARSRELLDFTLAPYLDAAAGRLSMADILPAGVRAHPMTRTLTTPDFADRMNGYKAALDSQVYTLDQLQALEHDHR